MPFLAGRSVADQRRCMIEPVRQVEQETAERRRANRSRPTDARLAMCQRPHATPKNFKSSPAPRLHTTTRQEYIELLDARREKLVAYRIAADELKRGERQVEFPPDCLCFPPGLPFAEPAPT